MPDSVEVQIATIATKMDLMHETTGEILTRVREQNGKVADCVKDIALNRQQIETNEENIESQGKTIKSNTLRIGLLVGAIVGLEKVAVWLAG